MDISSDVDCEIFYIPSLEVIRLEKYLGNWKCFALQEISDMICCRQFYTNELSVRYIPHKPPAKQHPGELSTFESRHMLSRLRYQFYVK